MIQMMRISETGCHNPQVVAYRIEPSVPLTPAL